MTEWGKQLGMGPEETAEGILAVVTATMARGIRKVSVEQGVDVRRCHLIAFGGAGPLHGSDLMQELGMPAVVIPPAPGIASAVGMLDAPVRHDFATPVAATADTGVADLAAVFEELEARAAREMGTGDFQATRLVDARYIGQSYELGIDWTPDWEEQRELFDTVHEQRYGFRDPAATMEVVVARLVATVPHRDQAPTAPPAGEDTTAPEPREHRRVYINGNWCETPIFERPDIPTGAVIPGPAVINQFDSTTYLRPDQEVRCDEHGFLHLSRKDS